MSVLVWCYALFFFIPCLRTLSQIIFIDDSMLNSTIFLDQDSVSLLTFPYEQLLLQQVVLLQTTSGGSPQWSALKKEIVPLTIFRRLQMAEGMVPLRLLLPVFGNIEET